MHQPIPEVRESMESAGYRQHVSFGAGMSTSAREAAANLKSTDTAADPRASLDAIPEVGIEREQTMKSRASLGRLRKSQ